jgi:site-specific recombinase XerD
VAGGEDLKVVSELLGHAGIAITADIYASVLPKLKNDAANRLDRLLGVGW